MKKTIRRKNKFLYLYHPSNFDFVTRLHYKDSQAEEKGRGEGVKYAQKRKQVVIVHFIFLYELGKRIVVFHRTCNN